ncbi:signal transducer and activator of transcription 5B-like isoform X3 [Eriocheir sinensis]|uniref:signal transducer and activator of transcription 5B-like isoform X3 n=1 Tax=Eriocheir sinensis TaxID=95602 RepID=UPI0021C6CC9F|nr:signal transducer and activator of transcription 5B-like isoform X3 [Eriocheir sinensis]
MLNFDRRIIRQTRMSLWNRAQQLPPDALRQVQNVYGEQFPIEVRHYLAGWIEDKMHQWNEIDPENVSHSQYAHTLITQLIQELENKALNYGSNEDLFLVRIRLDEAANMFKTRYLNNNPLGLVSIIRDCLKTELHLVQQHENMLGISHTASMVMEPCAEIVSELDILHRRTRETADELRQLEQEQESFALQYHDCTKINAHLSHIQSQEKTQQNREMEANLRRRKELGEQQLAQKVSGLLQRRMDLAEKHKGTIDRLNILQQRILDEELINWKREQQMAGNGKSFNSGKLDQIQEWCEALAEIIWLNRHQIKECERHQTKIPITPHGGVDMLPTLNSHITRLLSSLVTSTFIIEKQPPQVMKTNTRFSATVRLLVGGKLNVNMTPPQVRVSIISEAQANALLKNDQMSKGEMSGEILNNTGTMEYHQGSRQLSVSFRNMQLRKIKRAEKKGTESVMDEKFSLLFQSQFSVGGGELVFQVWTLSLPVVVIVHGNQEPHAWATVSWDNAFAEQGRIPFTVPEKVPWPQVADMLDAKFKSATGRGLTEDNLKFLAGKAFRSPQIQDFTNMMLSWSQFCKEPLSERNFTFWEWFFAVMKVTKEHLRQPWNDGSIMGFVGRPQAEEMLKNSKSGTFLLRFSDSELGGVTIAWMYEDTTKACDQRQVFMLQPFTSKSFAIRPLGDVIADLKYLLYLYPNIPKEQAFGKYYTPLGETTPQGSNGYVRPHLIINVPGWTATGSGESYPNTPQPMYPMHDAGLGDPPSVSSNPSDCVSTDQKPSLDSPLFDAANVLSDFPMPPYNDPDYPDILENLPDPDFSNFSLDFLQTNFMKQQ